MPEALCPGQEVGVTDAGGGHGVAAQGSAELIGGVRDMKVFVGIDPDGDLWETGWRGGCHCGPSDVRLWTCHRGSARVGTVLLRDSWSGSYEVTPSWRAASRHHWSTNLHSRHAPEGAAGKEIGQTSSDVTRTLPTNLSTKPQGNAGGSLIAVKTGMARTTTMG
jgi:hypothetical protein